MLKENDIKEFLQSRNIPYKENSSIWGIVFPNKVTYLLGPAATALSMGYHVLNFNNAGIAILVINNTTGKIVEDLLIFIPREKISSINFNKKLMSYNLIIQTVDGNIEYKVNKAMIGASWHKENLNAILNTLGN